VIPGLLNFQLTLNTGAVFGTGQGGRPIFIAVSIVAVFVILFLLYRSPANARLYQIGLALILGGALGNLYDRVLYSAVRDMLHMLPSTGLWPWIFNPADVALVLGVALVLLVSWLSEMKLAKQKKSKAA
jgi:signal peptidase II